MSSISQSSLRALGCIRLRARTRLELELWQPPPSVRLYAQLAPKVDQEDLESHETPAVEQNETPQGALQDRYGREFVRRHLQELDRARRAEHLEEKPGQGEPYSKSSQQTDLHGWFVLSPLAERIAATRAVASFPRVASHAWGNSSSRSEIRPLRQIPATSSRTENIKIELEPPAKNVQSAASRAPSTLDIDPSGNGHQFKQELTDILGSTSAMANPSAALVRALAHHREHASLSSVHTFNILLSYAARISNYHAMRKILREMQKGSVQWDNDTTKIVMKATLRGSGERGGKRVASEASRQDPSSEVKMATTDANDGQSALKRRLDAFPSPIADEHRQIVLNAGYWRSEKRAPESSQSPVLDSDADKAPSTRTSRLQDALSPRAARTHLPPSDVQLSPTLFLAFLRYILASNPQPPSLADSYAALVALDRPERPITSKHLTHLVQLYLHPSLYASFRPFWVVREMQRISKDGLVTFEPTSATLEKALLSLRLRRNRAKLALELVDYFRRKWGEESISIACWRIVGRYGLEGNNTTAQELAMAGGQAALARQIENDARKAKDVFDASESTPDNTDPETVDLFPGHGLDRRKWGRVRQTIVRRSRQARRAEARQQEETAEPPHRQ